MDTERKDIVSLREHLESRIEHQEKFFMGKFEDLYRSTDLLAKQMEKRLEGMNEFREQLKDQASNFVTRLEFDTMHKEVEMLRRNEKFVEGKASQASVYGAYLIATITLIATLIKLFQ